MRWVIRAILIEDSVAVLLIEVGVGWFLVRCVRTQRQLRRALRVPRVRPRRQDILSGSARPESLDQEGWG